MYRSDKLLDTSTELLVNRYRAGIKLTRPELVNNAFNSNIATMLSMPFDIYFLDDINRIQQHNEVSASNCGFQGIEDGIGKTISTVAKLETYKSCEAHT